MAVAGKTQNRLEFFTWLRTKAGELPQSDFLDIACGSYHRGSGDGEIGYDPILCALLAEHTHHRVVGVDRRPLCAEVSGWHFVQADCTQSGWEACLGDCQFDIITVRQFLSLDFPGDISPSLVIDRHLPFRLFREGPLLARRDELPFWYTEFLIQFFGAVQNMLKPGGVTVVNDRQFLLKEEGGLKRFYGFDNNTLALSEVFR